MPTTAKVLTGRRTCKQVDRTDGAYRVGGARCIAEVDGLGPMRVVLQVNLESLCIDVDAQHYINAGARETSTTSTCAAETVYRARIIRLLYTQTIV